MYQSLLKYAERNYKGQYRRHKKSWPAWTEAYNPMLLAWIIPLGKRSTGRNNLFPYFVNSTETWSCLNLPRFRTWWSSFPWTGRVSVMFPSRKRTIMFPPHFCNHISVLSCFRYVSGDYFFLTHVQDRMINVSEILPLRTIRVNKRKFTLEMGAFNGSHTFNTVSRVALMQLLWSARGCHCFRF